MLGRFVEVSEAHLEALIEDPEAATMLFVSDSILQSLGGSTGGQPSAPSPSTPRATLDVDKAWHGLHYVLTGSAWDADGVLGQIVLGGTEIGEDELGYGPARYLTSEEVDLSSAALAEVAASADPLARFDPELMTSMSIYPGVWEADDREWLDDAFRRLAEFYAQAAAGGSAVLACLV
jgi:hypothetical protein